MQHKCDNNSRSRGELDWWRVPHVHRCKVVLQIERAWIPPTSHLIDLSSPTVNGITVILTVVSLHRHSEIRSCSGMKILVKCFGTCLLLESCFVFYSFSLQSTMRSTTLKYLSCRAVMVLLERHFQTQGIHQTKTAVMEQNHCRLFR